MVIQPTLWVSTLLTPRSKVPLLADWQQASGPLLRLLITPLHFFIISVSHIPFFSFLPRFSSPPSFTLSYYSLIIILLLIVLIIFTLFYNCCHRYLSSSSSSCLYFTICSCLQLCFSSLLSSSIPPTLSLSCILWF
jgi:hypothetical protein